MVNMAFGQLNGRVGTLPKLLMPPLFLRNPCANSKRNFVAGKIDASDKYILEGCVLNCKPAASTVL